MDAVPRTTPVRTADLDGPDAAAVGRLVAAYLVETEREKAARLGDHRFPGYFRRGIGVRLRTLRGPTPARPSSWRTRVMVRPV